LKENTMMQRLISPSQRLLALTLCGALAGALVLAWPGPARAADTDIVAEQRSPGDFEAIQSHDFHVVVRQGSTPALTVRAEAAQLPQVETVVENTAAGKTLVLRWKPQPGLSWHRKTPQIEVTAVRLAALSVVGSGDLSALGLKTPALRASVSGSGDLRLDGLETEALALAVSGSGDVLASGRTRSLEVAIAGSGDVKTEALGADEVRVRIAGSGDAAVQARRTLDVSIAGSGDVVYSGEARVTSRIAGSGSVRRR
jgi:hypothetical protein